MSNITNIVNSLIARAAKVDPIMVSILQEITNELNRLGIVIDPAPVVNSSRITSGEQIPPDPVTDLAYSLTVDNIVLTWSAPTVDSILYEIRLGSTWATADRILVTGNLSAYLDPKVVGTHTYLIKTLGTNGIYSINVDSVAVVIPALGTFSIVPQVIDNTVLLRWNEPTSSFRIHHYEITKDSVSIGQAYSTFFITSEPSAGTYVYGITAVDIATNESAEISITLAVNGPTDYVLRDTQNWARSGTLSNSKFDGLYLYANINLTETIQQHFDNNGWATPQAQVDAGYTYWIQPNLTTGYYEEVFDFGLIITNTVINIDYTYQIISGLFSFGLDIRVSDDNITYSSAYTTNAFFVTSVRYIKVRFTFTGSITSLIKFYDLIVSLSVKEEMDGGSILADSTDPTGTTAIFNKAFYDITSLTASAKDPTNPYAAVVEFSDIPNPTSFKIFAYNTMTGIRVTTDVYWKARGIM